MSIRERLSGIWLISMTLLSLFALTVFYVAQMWMDILVIRMAYLALAALQVTTLIIYLWGPEKLSFRPLKILYRLMAFSSVFVIPAFVFIFSGLLSQYHAVIPDRIDASAMAAEGGARQREAAFAGGRDDHLVQRGGLPACRPPRLYPRKHRRGPRGQRRLP